MEPSTTIATSHNRGVIRVVGMDPSLRNWGLATGVYYLRTGSLHIEKIDLINPVLPTGKQVRQNSVDLDAASQLYRKAFDTAKAAQAVFVEVPVGSQSSRAMASYGICCGVLGAIRANRVPLFEVTPTEVKLAGHGNKTATKAEMIAWATAAHPEAPWPTYRRRGIDQLSEAQAEHMADAIAAIHAGIATQQFQQLLPILAA